MTLSLSLSTDKTNYAPGEAVKVTANYADRAAVFTVNLTGTAQDPATGEIATATTSYTVTPSGTPAAVVALTDDQGGSYALQSNANGTALLAGAAPSAGKAIVSGYGGAEPPASQAGNAVSWGNHLWELEDWGTAPGQPKAANVTVDALGQVLTLHAAQLSPGLYAGAEADSARGDQGIAANASTWGYGTYRWSIGADLTALPPGLCLGLFTYWAASKGGPGGQKEIDIEFYSAGTIAGAPAFVQFGYYADQLSSVQGTPPGHVLVPGSQFAIPAGHGSLTAEFTWLPGSLRWRLSAADGTVLAEVTAVQGQKYSYTQLYGGNQFSGTVAVPATGKQQVIVNLWCPNGAPPPGDPAVAVPLPAFSYTQP